MTLTCAAAYAKTAGSGFVAAPAAEQVRRAPQELDARPLHVAGGVVDHRLEVRARLRERRALRGDVAIVEAVERHAELRDELEGGVELGPRGRHRVQPRLQPRPVER